MESRSASRRSFLRRTAFGTMALGPLGALTLRADARPTPSVGDPSADARAFAHVDDLTTIQLADDVGLTRRSQEGPFYRAGAPYRCKVSPPLAEGVCLVITGRVWGFDSKKPVPHAVIDLWHADVHGEYDNADGSFRNRARLITSETGAYEFETIHPTGYSNGPNFQRAPHIHFKVSVNGYRTLTSEMFFEGDAHHDIDPLFKPELVVKMACRETARGSIECGQFDIVLEKT
jgi:protocatechuate 3,4-dioxygenase beta subunit